MPVNAGSVLRVLMIATALGGLAPLAAQADEAEFFKGKTVRLIVGFAPGGAFDRTARLLAEHLPRHIPGAPVVVVENMPGAGSIVAANYIYNAAPRDGTVIGNFNGGITTQDLIEEPGIEFESEKFNWVGAMTKTRLVCMLNKKTGVKTVDDLLAPREKPVKFGALGGANEITTTPKFLKYMGGAVEVVVGYPSGQQIDLAIQQGEVDGRCQTWETLRVQGKAMLDSGDYTIFMQDGTERAEDLPDTPLIVERLAGTDHASVWSALTRPQAVTRPYAVPPGVPAERIDILRKAFLAATQDAGFQADVGKTGDLVLPSSGAEVEAAVASIMSTPEELVGAIRGLLAD